ncbi:(2Fe-2S)-binding protein [Amorphus orientalis]|uniref:Carbon-monoxide dehydrogenase small subunit n=1 Tax=Amorphus orientalis TaxID=649198 RepID=A0AAE3VPZ4_9HYPH|nr:(2Fe-2S)-binding protein [Amorphus orientalis]MDQ0316006.1 carbon-monoxide dehydrogenase small subunit [Amorphus orientalis]
MSGRVSVSFRLNGSDCTAEVEPRQTVADLLRAMHLTGTPVGCEQGVCGSCTVIVDDDPARACLMFACQLEGRSLRTVEGLATGGRLHALQEAFDEEDAVQCGFCTPGFLMLAAAALEHDPFLNDDAIDALVSMNLCRCTGYGPIRRAIRRAAKEARRAP